MDNKEHMERAIVMISTFDKAIKNGFRHYRKSTDALLPTSRDILEALRDEGSVLIKPPE